MATTDDLKRIAETTENLTRLLAGRGSYDKRPVYFSPREDHLEKIAKLMEQKARDDAYAAERLKYELENQLQKAERRREEETLKALRAKPFNFLPPRENIQEYLAEGKAEMEAYYRDEHPIEMALEAEFIRKNRARARAAELSKVEKKMILGLSYCCAYMILIGLFSLIGGLAFGLLFAIGIITKYNRESQEIKESYDKLPDPSLEV